MSREAEIRALVTRVIEESLETQDGEIDSGAARARIGDRGNTVAIGCDHGGFELKMKLIPLIEGLGYICIDCGCDSTESVDYPDYAHDVARRVGANECSWGIVIDGAGIGSCIVANKVPGVRAAMCYDISTARNSRQHNHANVLSLGAGLIGFGLASQIVESWFTTEWGGSRHAQRVAKITAIEKNYCRGCSS